MVNRLPDYVNLLCTLLNYIQNKELIEGKVLVPFIGAPMGIRPDSVMDFVFRLANETIKEYPEFFENLRYLQKESIGQAYHWYLQSPQTSAILYEGMEIIRFLITTSGFKTAFPSVTSANVEFGDSKNKIYLSKLVELGAPWLGDNTHIVNNIPWPTPKDELGITSIAGIPPQEILGVRYKEQSAIENFRYKTRKKLIDLRASAGTKDYSTLVQSFQSEQKGQIAEIKILAEHIRKDHLRKVSHQIGLMTFSAAGAILSAAVATQNPVSLIGVGVAGAGLTSGISKLLETWITYQAEMEKLRERDSYILWRIQQNIRR